MKKICMVLLLTIVSLFLVKSAYGVSAPEVTITARTTNSITITVDDTTGMAAQDSLIFIFALTAADSLDGTGYEFGTTSTDTTGYTLTSLPERTWGFVIVRADSSGNKAYSARDSVRTLAPQIIDSRRPDMSAPYGLNAYDANSMPGGTLGAASWTINGTERDSTGVYFSAPFTSFLISYVGVTDSTNVKLIPMIGYTDEDNDTADLEDDNTFTFTPGDTLAITTAGTYTVLLSADYGSYDGNILNEMFYLVILGVAGNDNSTGTVLSPIRITRGN